MNISEDDLIKFHKSHFGFIPNRENVKWTEEEVDNSIDEPIYYPDGVIRTITDEEIEFFRSSELRKRELNKELSRPITTSVTPANTLSSNQSIEESKPYTPIANDTSKYSTLFGEYESYIQRLDDECDTMFINICRNKKVQHYYPVLPL